MVHFDEVYRKNLEKQFFQDKPQEDMPALAKLLKKNGMKKVLDHGCGSGRNTVYLAKRGFDVSGFDISTVGLSKTRKWLKREGVNAKLRKQDIFKRLPYRNESFDAVVSIRAIDHNTKEPIKKSIGEIYRVLRHGGYFYLQTTRQTTRVFNYPHPIKYERVAKNTYKPLEGYENGVIHYMFTRESIKYMFSQFKILDIHMNKPKLHYAILAQKV